MTEERIVEHTDAGGNVLERTVERTSSGSGGIGTVFAVLLVLALIVGGIFFLSNNSETKKDDAIAAAAGDVGDAAKQIGDSAEKAVDKLNK